jgi:diaminopimelate epimerase
MNRVPTAFTKYHGNGNDFIVFDLVEETDARLLEIITDKAKSLCDRHRGIGGDGVIMLYKHDGQWCMTLINSDGSRARNCGNGLRVAARHIARMYNVQGTLRITFEGITYDSQIIDDEVSVFMGLCTIKNFDILMVPEATRVSQGHIGNDHLIFLLNDGENKYHRMLTHVQDKLPANHDFNIGFLWPDKEGTWISRVCERGVGFTKSCGTGAIVAAAFLQTIFPMPAEIVINQPGGTLKVFAKKIESNAEFSSFEITQQGNAVQVFKGICEIANS